MGKLTDLQVQNAKPKAGEYLLADGDCLFLRVRPTSRTWIVRIIRRGTKRVHTIGTYPSIKLKNARAEAARIVAIERGDARELTRDAVQSFMDTMIRPHYRRVKNAETYARVVSEALGALSLDAVRPVDVSRMIIDHRRSAPIAAMRLLGFAKQFFSWCISLGLLERSPAADVRPAAFGVKEEPRERVLSDDEIKAFWNADDLPHRALLRFLLLTGLRIGEAQAALAEWIDDDGWLNLPEDVMKNGKPHRAFLSTLATHEIEKDAKPHLFRCVSETAVQAAVKRWHIRHGVEERWTPHDLRRSFASRCGDLKVAPHVIAKALGHTFSPSPSLSVYLRSDWEQERAEAANLLADDIAKLVSTKPALAVVAAR